MGHPNITDLPVNIHDFYTAEVGPRTGEVAVAEWAIT